MSKVLIVSAQPGVSPADRRVIEAVSSASSSPTSSTEGHFLNRIEFLHLFFNLTNPDTTNTATFYVQIWWWNPITEMWHKGERLKVNDDDIHTIECQGLNRIFLQVDQIVYAGSDTPYLDAWVGMVVPV